MFTTALLESLSGEGVAERDGFVRVSDVIQWVSRRVPELTNDQQHPVIDWAAGDNFRLARYGAGALETRGVPDWLGVRAPLSELMAYPPGPLVPAMWLPGAIIDAFAELYPTVQESTRLLNGVNSRLIKEDPGATTLRAGALPDIRLGSLDYWFYAFTEARKHGPRMMAALLLSVDEKLLPEPVRKDRNELLRRMRVELR
jgi:hypothetical protein